MIQRAVIGENQVRARADLDSRRRNLDALFHQPFCFLKESFRIDHHPIAEDAHFPGMNNSRRQQMKHERTITHLHRMAGIVPTLIPGDDVKALGKQVHNLAFAFIAPLGADHYNSFSHSFSSELQANERWLTCQPPFPFSC